MERYHCPRLHADGYHRQPKDLAQAMPTSTAPTSAAPRVARSQERPRVQHEQTQYHRPRLPNACSHPAAQGIAEATPSIHNTEVKLNDGIRPEPPASSAQAESIPSPMCPPPLAPRCHTRKQTNAIRKRADGECQIPCGGPRHHTKLKHGVKLVDRAHHSIAVLHLLRP